MGKKIDLAVIFSINTETGAVRMVGDAGAGGPAVPLSCYLFKIPLGTERGMRRELEQALIAQDGLGQVEGTLHEREECKKAVCLYCRNTSSFGPSKGPDGQGRWHHQIETATGEPTVSEWCRATPIFERERKQKIFQGG